MFGIWGREFLARLSNGDITVTELYNKLYLTLAFVTFTILTVSLVADVAGYNGLNILLIPLWVTAVFWLKYYPRNFVATLVLSETAKTAGLIENMKAGFKKWHHLINHAALFGGVFFLTRFLVPVKDYPFMGFLMLGALIVLGLWTWIYREGTAYKRYVLGLVLVALAVALWGSFNGKPKGKTGHFGQISTWWQSANYRKTFDLEITSFRDTKKCGIQPGTRTFSIPSGAKDRIYVTVDGEATDISSAVRLNETAPGDKFEVDESGCVAVAFAYNTPYKQRPIEPRVIHFTVE